jgi:L-alanine-DL-glutamate epimerase-like enolase superfamily enzyme
MAKQQDQHRTVQDDRAALEIDAEDALPLVEGEGAPLADDGVGAEDIDGLAEVRRRTSLPVVTGEAL